MRFDLRQRWMVAAGGAIVAVAIIIAIVVATGGSDNTARTSVPPPAAQDAELVAYQGAEIAGGAAQFNLADVLGQGRPVIVNFWAANCPPCRLEMPWFQAAFEEFGDRVLLLGIDIGPFVGLGSNEEGAALLTELGITYPTAAATDDELVQRYRILAMPTTVLFDASGEQVRVHAGLLTDGQVRSAFEDLAGS